MEFDITKLADGTLHEVAGILSSEAVDRDKQVFDYAGSKPFFEQWSNDVFEATSKTAEPGQESYGNVRLMHNRQTIGKLTKISFDDDAKVIYGVARITDDKTWEDIRKGVYSAFSIAGDLVRSTWKSGKQWITVRPKEVSVVDYPANPQAVFDWAKGVTFAKFAGAMDIEKRDVSDEERASLADKGKAMPDGSYPIATVSDLHNAIHAYGRASNPEAVKAHIKRRAKELGEESSLPETWKAAFLPDAEPVKNQVFERENADLTKEHELADNTFVASEQLTTEDKSMPETQKLAETEIQKAARTSIHGHLAAMKAAASAHLDAAQKHVSSIHDMCDKCMKLAGEPAQTTGEERAGGQPGAKSETDTVVKTATAETDVEKAARKEEKRKARIAETAEIVKAAIAPLAEKVEKITKAAEAEAARVTGNRTDVVVTGKEVTKSADVTADPEIKKLADAAFLNGNKPADPKALRALYDKTANYDKPEWPTDRAGRRV